MCAYFIIVLLHYLIVCTYTKNWTLWLFLMYFASFLLFAPIFIMIYNTFDDTPISLRLQEIAFSSFFIFWALVLSLVALCFLPISLIQRFHLLLKPRLLDLILTKQLNFDIIKQRFCKPYESRIRQALLLQRETKVNEKMQGIKFESEHRIHAGIISEESKSPSVNY